MSALTPYLCVADARAALDWYTEVLGAVVTHEPIVMDDGRIVHRGAMAELAGDEALQRRLLGLSLEAHA